MNNHADSYSNTITAMGSSGDKSSGSRFIPTPDLTSSELNWMYEQDAMASRIVDRLPDDATREGVFLTGTDTDVDFASIQSELEDLNAVGQVADAWRWSRLYGGALLVMVVNDGLKMEEPLDLSHADKLASLQVIESPYIIPSGWNPGLGARAFRNPSHYDITVPFGSRSIRRVHRTRAIRFDGVRVPPTRMIERNGWGPSILDRVRTEVVQLGNVMGYSRNIMHDLSLLLLKIEGFRRMLAGSEEDKQEARAVIESIKWNADNLHTIALDSKDDYVELSRTVSGLEALLDKFIDALVRATDMPRTVLLGEQPTGLNASADSEIRSWFDYVASQQRLTLTPVLTRLLTVLFQIRANQGETIPDEWVVNYNPLWQPTEKERAETYATRASADEVYLMHDIVSADEVRADLEQRKLITVLETPPDRGES
jgi:phage-related protein (TIGR01555 family)